MILHRRSQWLCVGFLVSDLVLTGLAWLSAYYVRFESGWLAVRPGNFDAVGSWRTSDNGTAIDPPGQFPNR